MDNIIANEIKDFKAKLEQKKTEQISKQVSARYASNVAPQIDVLTKNAVAEKEKALQAKNAAILTANEEYTAEIKRIEDSLTENKNKLIAENRQIIESTVGVQFSEIFGFLDKAQAAAENE